MTAITRMSGTISRRGAYVATVAAAFALASAGAANAATLPMTGHLSEKQLRKLETRLFGAEHAAAHAANRARERAARKRPRETAKNPTRKLMADGPPALVGAWDPQVRRITV